jgi:hypothetical protein
VDVKEINPAYKYAIYSIPATVLIMLPSFTDPINLPKVLALLPLALTSLILFFVMRNRFTKGGVSRIRKIQIGFYLLLGSGMLISGFLGSQNYVRVLFGTNGRNNGLIYYLSALTLVLVILSLRINYREIYFLQRTLIWTSLVFAGYCLLQYLNLDPVAWDNIYNRVIGTLGNPNFSASALATFSIFWLYLAVMEQKTGSKRVFLFALPSLVMSFLSWSTDSLQGLVVLALGVGLILYSIVRERIASQFIPYLFALGGSLGLSLLFISFLGLGPLGNTLEQYTLKLRGFYASFGLQAMADSPWTGVGVDNYINAFRKFKSEEFVSQYGPVLSSNNAHSTPAQMGATFGLVVFSLYCLIHLCVLYRALAIINSRDTSKSYLKAIAILWVLVFSQSLLSIEIIGLGVMNWIIGAVLLSAGGREENYSSQIQNKKMKVKSNSKTLPAWTGSLTIATLLIGSIPAVAIAREDQAYKNISLSLADNDESRKWIRENYNDLTGITLLEAEKFGRVIPNMYLAQMSQEIESAVKNLYRVDGDNAYVGDLLATFYQNSNQTVLEIEVREKLRSVDPLSRYLELALAKAYSRVGDEAKLRDSVDRLRKLSSDSPEYEEALLLIEDKNSTP